MPCHHTERSGIPCHSLGAVWRAVTLLGPSGVHLYSLPVALTAPGAPRGLLQAPCPDPGVHEPCRASEPPGRARQRRQGARPDPRRRGKGPRDPHCRLPPAGVSSLAREPAAAASPNRGARGGAAGRGGASGSPAAAALTFETLGGCAAGGGALGAPRHVGRKCLRAAEPAAPGPGPCKASGARSPAEPRARVPAGP